MPRLATLKQLVRPSGVVFFAAVGQALGGVAALALAYAYADVLRDGGIGIGALLLIGGALGCGLALLPTHVLSLLCGWAFGLPVGLAVALCGATLGSPLGFAIGKRLAGPGVLELVSRNPRGSAICEAIARSSRWRAFVLIGLLRLSPVVPYGSTNVLAAVFNVPMLPFLLGTFLGLAPRAAAAVFLGAGLEQLDSDARVSPWFWGIGIGATVLALIVMSWAAKRALDRVAAEAVVVEPAV
ncbi:MAG: TVP38/TMEM64 family protein [Phycisphaeraceae bacterium]